MACDQLKVIEDTFSESNDANTAPQEKDVSVGPPESYGGSPDTLKP
jgi:hypothetical protein